MKEKYIDEKVGIYFFGHLPKGGTVVIHDGDRDLFWGLPEDLAEKIVDAQQRFREELYDILEDFEEPDPDQNL